MKKIAFIVMAGLLSVYPTSAYTKTKITTVFQKVNVYNQGDSLSLTISKGNKSTCVWRYDSGNAYIPNINTTVANAGDNHEIKFYDTIWNIDVRCFDDLGGNYISNVKIKTGNNPNNGHAGLSFDDNQSLISENVGLKAKIEQQNKSLQQGVDIINSWIVSYNKAISERDQTYKLATQCIGSLQKIIDTPINLPAPTVINTPKATQCYYQNYGTIGQMQCY